MSSGPWTGQGPATPKDPRDEQITFLTSKVERISRELDATRAERDEQIASLRAKVEWLTRDRDEWKALEESAADAAQLAIYGRRVLALWTKRQLAEARAGYHALDRNWNAIHDRAMKPIREAVGNPDATVPEIVAAIRAGTEAREKIEREARAAERARCVTELREAKKAIKGEWHDSFVRRSTIRDAADLLERRAPEEKP